MSEPFACIRPVANAAANFLRIFEYALRCRNQKNRTRWLRQDGNLRFGKLFVLSLCLKRYCPKRYCAQDAGSEACGRSLVAALNRHIQVRGSCVSSNCDRCDGLKQYTSARCGRSAVSAARDYCSVATFCLRFDFVFDSAIHFVVAHQFCSYPPRRFGFASRTEKHCPSVCASCDHESNCSTNPLQGNGNRCRRPLLHQHMCFRMPEFPARQQH